MRYLVVDLETTGLNPRIDKILDIAVFDPVSKETQIFTSVEEFGESYLYNYADRCIFHNFKFDLSFLRKAGLNVPQDIWEDTMLMHHLYDENLSHSLDNIIQTMWKDNYKEVFWNKYKTYEEAPEVERTEYALKDVKYTWKLFEFLDSKIDPYLKQHVYRVAWELFETECRGLKIDLDYTIKMAERLKEAQGQLITDMKREVATEISLIELERWEKEIDKRKTDKGKAGTPRPSFNFASNAEINKLLYSKLLLPVQYNKEDKPTVDDGALDALKDFHPFVPLLREHRAISKVYNAFIEPALDNNEVGRVYPSFNVNGTVTGRISSSQPNMQQLPSSGGIRGVYVPDPGYRFIGADYSQLEVTIAAHFSRDENLLKIVLEGASQHDITANALGIPRSQAKTVNFASQYGCSHFKLAKILGCTIEKGQELWNKYWDTYKGLRRFTDQCSARVDQGLPIINPIGRKRHFEKKKRMPWDSAYRQAFNSLIQGTGADITNMAFYIVSEELKKQDWGYGLFVVHDEVLIAVKEDCCKEAEELLVSIMLSMKDVFNLSVPLKCESSGPMSRWED